MKFTLSWLFEYIDTKASCEEICIALTNIGLEVESVDDLSKKYNGFSVAQIVEAKPHQDSKKLKICQVKNSQSQDLIQVICGAANARDGIKVAMADIGAIVPNNQMEIKKAKIAGVESCGMLCSAQELDIDNEDDGGIIEIDEKWSIGTPIAEVFGLNDVVIEINVTPNRGDCLGVYGIARDLAAYGIGRLRDIKLPKITTKEKFKFNIDNSAKDLCPNISFCYIKNLQNVQSPDWLKKRLLSVGVNSISAIVDVTNYIMLTFNQPMHAYDASKINGDSINIRLANDNEEFLTLKDQQINLDDQSLVIADDSQILSLAGIIGGKNSACDDQTNQIILEAAFFDDRSVARTGRKYNILSDSRYRFERGVDVKTSEIAINFAINLINQICGGENSNIKVVSDKYNSKEVKFNIDEFNKIIGIKIEADIAIDILKKLGFELKKITNLGFDEFLLKIPSWRHDISISRDIIEEVIRIYGYNKINNSAIKFEQNLDKKINIEDQIRVNLVNRNYQEVCSWSFVDSKIIDKFTKFNSNMLLANPISQEMDYLRPNLIIGLLQSLAINFLRGFNDLSFFEIGNVFIENPQLQKKLISGVRVGKNKPSDHYNEVREYDFFDVKSDILDLITIFGIRADNIKIDNSNAVKYYHPYRFANLYLGKKIIGYIGELNPLILKDFDIKERVYGFELFVDNLPKPNVKIAKPYQISDFQESIRDFAFLIDNDMAIGGLIDDIYKIDRNLIQNVVIFDIYRGQKIADDKKSIALRVSIQSLEKTLTSAEIDNISNQIIDLIESKYQANLRR